MWIWASPPILGTSFPSHLDKELLILMVLFMLRLNLDSTHAYPIPVPGFFLKMKQFAQLLPIPQLLSVHESSLMVDGLNGIQGSAELTALKSGGGPATILLRPLEVLTVLDKLQSLKAVKETFVLLMVDGLNGMQSSAQLNVLKSGQGPAIIPLRPMEVLTVLENLLSLKTVKENFVVVHLAGSHLVLIATWRNHQSR